MSLDYQGSSFLLNLDEDFKTLTSSSKSLVKELSNLNKINTQFSGLAGSVDKTVKSLNLLKNIAGSALGTFFGISSIATTFSTFNTVLSQTRTLMKDLTGYARGLTFAEAIAGSKELADNLQYLEKAKGGLLRLGLITDSIFNTQEITQWSAQSVAAFATVEQAAYRLSTITVQGNERSIDSLYKNIEAMRELQKATNFAVDSISLLNTQYDIASAGFTSRKDQSNVGKAAINLSQAGFGDVAGSTNAVVRVLKALGEESTQAETRAAQLFETTKVGLLTLDQLTGSIGGLSVQAKSLGVDFEEVTAALAGLTLKGVSTSEAETKLVNLFAEIAAGSEEANRQLANFRDSAGKPIQINASALKEKGLKGIIDDLKTATSGGQVSAIQKIFSSKESQEAVQLLISLGDDFEAFTDRIRNASSETLNTEAQNRAKTLVGAYQKSLNETQKGIEDFGKGLAPSALENLAGTNQVTSKLANAGAEGAGKLVGTLTGIVDKTKAIGGFLLNVFSIVAPLALFKFIFANLGKLGGIFKKYQKDGEFVWDTLKRAANESFLFIRTKFDSLLSYIIKRIKDLNNESLTVKVQQALPPGQESKIAGILPERAESLEANRQKQYERGYKNLNSPDRDVFDTIDVTPVSSTVIESSAKSTDKLKQNIKQVSEESTKSKFNTKSFLDSIISPDRQNKVVSGLGKVKQGLGGVFNGVKSFAGGVGKEMLSMFAGIGVAGLAASVGMALVTGWFTTISGVLDRRTIPELQEMRDTLKDLKNVDGLQEIVDRLDPITASLKDVNGEISDLDRLISGLKGTWNTVTGAALQYNIIQEEIVNAQDKLRASIDKNIDNSKKGIFGAESTKGIIAEDKISKGIELTSEDTNALEEEQRQRIQEIDVNIALQRQKIRDFEAKGNGDLTQLQKMKDELKTLQEQSKEEKKQLELQLKQVQLRDAVNKLQNISTVIPLDIQLGSNREQSITNQIKDISTTFKDGLNGALNDPEKFDNLKSNVDAVLKGIAIQAELDPESAAKLKTQLEATLGEDLTRLYIANPQLQETARNTNKVLTESTVRNSQSELTGRTATFNVAEGLGSQSTALYIAKYEANVKAINEQVKVLTDEFAKPETTLARQLELTAQLEELEAKRVNLETDLNIKTELTGRKQNLALSQELYNLEQAKLNLYSQENKFNLFSIAASQAKLNAAQAELKVKKESLNIANREEEIKKQNIVKSLESKVARDSNRVATILGGNAKTGEDARRELEINKQLEQSRLADKIRNKKLNIDLAAKEKTKELKNQRDIFDDKETGANSRNDIVQAVQTAVRTSNSAYKDASNIFSKKEIDKLLLGSKDEAASVLFNSNNKLKNADKVQSLLLNSTTTGFKFLNNNSVYDLASNKTTNDTVNKGLTAIADNRIREAQKIADVRINAERDKAGLDTQQSTANNNLNTNINATRRKIDKAEDIRTQSQSILGNVIGTSAVKALDKGIGTVIPQLKGFFSREDNTELETSKANANSVKQDLIDTKTINNIKELVADFDSVIKVSIAKIENEYAAREKTIKQSEMLSDALSKVTSNTEIFGDGITAANLELFTFESASPYERLAKDAEMANKQIDLANSERNKLVDNLNAKLSEAIEAGVSPDKIKELTTARDTAVKDRDKGKEESVIDRQTVVQQTELGKLNVALKESSLKIKQEYASREQIIKGNLSIADAFSSLSGTLGNVLNTILPNSSVGASINTKAIEIKAVADTNQRTLDRDKQDKLLSERLKAADKLIETAKKSGLSEDVINRLQKNREDTQKEVTTEKEITTQKNSILNVNDRLSIFASRLEESNAKVKEQIDLITKQADIAKDIISLEQRRKDLAVENNKSGTGSQSSLIGFLSKNNPFATLLQQRLDVRQTEDDAVASKAQNVTEAKKEIIDTTLQKAQLDLEQQNYENALSQTALLADVLTVLQGGTATISSENIIQDSISKITERIQTARAIGAERTDILNQRLNFIPKELESKNRNIDRETTSKQLSILGSNIQAANFDLIKSSVTQAQKNVAEFRRDEVSIGSLDDPKFRNTIDKINSVSKLVSKDSIKEVPRPNIKPQASANINAPVTITIAVKDSNVDNSQSQTEFRTYVGKQIDKGLNDLSKSVINALSK